MNEKYSCLDERLRMLVIAHKAYSLASLDKPIFL